MNSVRVSYTIVIELFLVNPSQFHHTGRSQRQRSLETYPTTSYVKDSLVVFRRLSLPAIELLKVGCSLSARRFDPNEGAQSNQSFCLNKTSSYLSFRSGICETFKI
jgi:hypothetical protein